jgi:hypothetical protein
MTTAQLESQQYTQYSEDRLGAAAMTTYEKLVELSKAACGIVEVDFRFCTSTRLDELMLLRKIGAEEEIRSVEVHSLFSVVADEVPGIDQDLRIVRKSLKYDDGKTCNDYKAFTEERFRTQEVATTIAKWFGVAKKAEVKYYGSVR